ncbi:hypothetical protein OPV22_012552 [Ensete ventricosum]|uniref:Uncharacterized protein n=1 Tax=Ensete ventricosum TaxID=4639 RepID=A0AAV8R7U9_ENSVE|nr:hypothetical protein OPV22_012552 [Ensete ventricosum]
MCASPVPISTSKTTVLDRQDGNSSASCPRHRFFSPLFYPAGEEFKNLILFLLHISSPPFLPFPSRERIYSYFETLILVVLVEAPVVSACHLSRCHVRCYPACET